MSELEGHAPLSDELAVRRLEIMLESTSDIITVIDERGVALHSNAAASRLVRLRGEDGVEASMFDFIHPEDHEVARAALGRGVSAGRPVRPVEVRVRHEDGTWRYVEAQIDDYVDDEAVGGYVVTIRDITDRVRRQEESARNERRLASIVENIDDVIVILGRDLLVSWVSPGIERLIDAPAYTNVGENAFNDMHPDDVEPVLGVIQSAMEVPDGRGRCELRLAHRRLGWRWVEAAVVNRLDDPAVEGLVCTLRDITDQKAANAELQEISEQERALAAHLREMDRLKDQFLATVSHELRTPLTSVRGFSDLLLRRGEELDSATRDELIARIDVNARDMEDMIGQLLDFSLLQARRFEAEPEHLLLAEMITSMLTRLEDHLGDHEVVTDVGDHEVWADRRAVDHVLRNLLTNAARYSAAGTRIEVVTSRQDDEVWIEVRDQGIGIPESEHALIFQSFYQASPAVPGRRGTGVGLNIARRYAQLLSGRLWLESTPGEGSTFFFALPVERTS